MLYLYNENLKGGDPVPIGIVIAVAAVLVIVAAVVSHFVTVSNLRKNAESKIGNEIGRASCRERV